MVRINERYELEVLELKTFSLIQLAISMANDRVRVGFSPARNELSVMIAQIPTNIDRADDKLTREILASLYNEEATI